MQRPGFLLICTLIAAGLIWLVVDPQGWKRTRRLQEDVASLKAANVDLRGENERLRRELLLLADDPQALERAAREELGLVRPGEVIFRLREGGDAAAR